MRPNWPKLASLAQKTWHFSYFQFCECVHCSQGSFLLESINWISTWTVAVPEYIFCFSCPIFRKTQSPYDSEYSAPSEYFEFYNSTLVQQDSVFRIVKLVTDENNVSSSSMWRRLWGIRRAVRVLFYCKPWIQCIPQINKNDTPVVFTITRTAANGHFDFLNLKMRNSLVPKLCWFEKNLVLSV